MLRTVTLCVVALSLAMPLSAAPSRENAHVRPVHPDLLKLVDEGVAQSDTFRSLVDRLQQTDVVALIEYGNLPTDLAGGLRFITRAGSLRLLRVSIKRTLARRQMIATIAHELQHALEIAAAAEVVDEASLQSFYRKIDRHGPAVDRFDTDDAQRVGQVVGADLAAAKPAESGFLAGADARRAVQRKTR
jgi:hypothetical protein